MEVKRAIKGVMFWVVMSLIFNAGIYFFMGSESALEFFGGYVIEQSLSVDNLFLFLLIFGSFGLPAYYQKRVLNYGIIGAMLLRLLFILLGINIVNKFHWILYIFGLILIISGFKMFFGKEEIKDFNNSLLLRGLKKIMPFTDKIQGEKFFIRKNKILYATPLFAILVLIEGSDILFAVDSIPAIFSITTNAFIVYTSNMFAILGLRNMYFLLEKIHSIFAYVKYGVALILVFTGLKLLLLFFNIEITLIFSLSIIFLILALSIAVSIAFNYKD